MKKIYLLSLIALLSFMPVGALGTVSGEPEQRAVEVSYANNQLRITGYEGVVQIKVYDMLGRLIIERKLQMTLNRSQELILPQGQVFILQVETPSFKRSIRVVSQL